MTSRRSSRTALHDNRIKGKILVEVTARDDSLNNSVYVIGRTTDKIGVRFPKGSRDIKDPINPKLNCAVQLCKITAQKTKLNVCVGFPE
jgi:hypothetical protein